MHRMLVWKIAVALIALSLIAAGSSSAWINHAEAFKASCSEGGQLIAKQENQRLDASGGEASQAVSVEPGDKFVDGKSGASDLGKGCCNLFCAPMVVMPTHTEYSAPPAIDAVWAISSAFFSPAKQGGLKRPPRDSGHI